MFQLGYVPHGEEFGGRISIPYLTPNGVVQIKYRCADLSHGDHKGISCGKYLYEAGLGTHLYNAQALIGLGDTVVVTEGELDAICVQGLAGIPAVSYPGVKNWQKFYRYCFESVSEVVVVSDGDQVGREAAAKVAQSIGMHARVVDLPDGFDSNRYIIEKGVSAFEQRIMQ